MTEKQWQRVARGFYYAANGLILGAVPALWLDLISATQAAASYTLGVGCVVVWLVIGQHVYRLMMTRTESQIRQLKEEAARSQ